MNKLPKLFLFGLIGLAVLTVSAFSARVVMAQDTASVEQAIYDSSDASTAFTTFIDDNYANTSEDYYEQFNKESEKTESALRDAIELFTIEGLDDATAATVVAMRDATDAEADTHVRLRAAIAANDLRESDRAWVAQEQAVNDFTAAYDEYSRLTYGLTDAQYMTAYTIALVVSGIVAATTLGWMLLRNFYVRATNHPKDAPRKQRLHLFLLSLVPLVGAVITVGSYYLTSAGEYIIATGLIIFGSIAYIVYLIRFIIMRRKASTNRSKDALEKP